MEIILRLPKERVFSEFFPAGAGDSRARLLLFFGPVPLNLFRPASVAFPGVKRRVDTASPLSGNRRFGNPFTVLLPAVGIGRTIRTQVCLSPGIFRFLLAFGAVVT